MKDDGGSGAVKRRPRIRRRREVSAGGVIWRRLADGVEIVLVRPRGRKIWVLPKGHVEKGETTVQAACREAREESGLEVASTRPLGAIRYLFSRPGRRGRPRIEISKRVHFFLMESEGGDVSRHDDEMDEAAWLPASEALRRATHASERGLIEKALAIVTG